MELYCLVEVEDSKDDKQVLSRDQYGLPIDADIKVQVSSICHRVEVAQ